LEYGTCNILQEYEGNLPLAAELNEVSSLQGGLGEQNTVVTDDAHRIPVQTGETYNQFLS
jgi:hypothetical protein